MTEMNHQTRLSARVAILVLTIISIAEIAFRVVLTIVWDGAIQPSAMVAEVIFLVPRLFLLLYAIGLYGMARARILPFILFLLLTVLSAFDAMGSLADYIQLLSRKEEAFGASGIDFLQILIAAVLSTLAFVLLIVGSWKSFSKPIFSIVPICILLLCAGVALGYNGFLAIKPVLAPAETPTYDSRSYALATFKALSNLFFYLAIGSLLLKNRTLSVRSTTVEE